MIGDIMSSSKFKDLPLRQRYGSNRRSELLSKTTNESYLNYLEIETELDDFIKRKQGYSDWDKNWDIGFHMRDSEVFILLSKRDTSLDNFEVLEKVKYDPELKISSWLMDSLLKHSKL